MGKSVVLTGFMGTGKTTIGRLLASRLSYKFLDTDTEVAAKDGRSIPEIFEQDGEEAFRRWERIVTQELAGRNRLVIATGGGLMLDEENACLLAQNAMVFCLTADPADILARVQKRKSERPLLIHSNPGKRIRELLAEREAGYARFPQINTSGRAPQEIVEELVKCISVILKSAK